MYYKGIRRLRCCRVWLFSAAMILISWACHRLRLSSLIVPIPHHHLPKLMPSPIFDVARSSNSLNQITSTRTHLRYRTCAISSEQARLRTLEVAKRATSPPAYDDFSPEYSLSLALADANDHRSSSPSTEDIMEDVTRALLAQKRAEARRLTTLTTKRADNPGSDISVHTNCSASSPSTQNHRAQTRSVRSMSSTMNARAVVISRPPTGEHRKEDTEALFDAIASHCSRSTPSRHSQSKSSLWESIATARPSSQSFHVESSPNHRSPGKRLAPLSRFNPFCRARSESLSSITDSIDTWKPLRRRMSALASNSISSS